MTSAFASNWSQNRRGIDCSGKDRSTAKSLDEAFPGRFDYRTVGPDFLDELTGERLELTTPGQVASYLARPGYQGVTMCTYVLSAC